MNKNWTPEEKAELVSLVETGMSHAEIAKQLGRTQRSIGKLASIIGVKSPNNRSKWPEEKHAKFLQLIQAGNTVYEIAEIMGITVAMVKNRTRYHRIKASPKLRVPDLTVEVKSRILSLHGQQWGVKYIAKETGISGARIRKYLREMGIKEFHYERDGKTVTHRKWTPEEELILLNMQESDSTRAIAKRLNRSVSEVQQHAVQKGMALSQGRLTIKEFAEEVGITEKGMSYRMKALGIYSRTKKGNIYHTRGLSPFECAKVLSDLLKNPGMFSFSNKRVKELLNYYQDLRDAGRAKEE